MICRTMFRRPSKRSLMRQIWPVGIPLVLVGFVLIARSCGADALLSWLLAFAASCLLLVLMLLLVQGVSAVKTRWSLANAGAP